MIESPDRVGLAQRVYNASHVLNPYLVTRHLPTEAQQLQSTATTRIRSLLLTFSTIIDDTSIITMSNYAQLHRQCRTLENLFDSKLTSYSQVVANISRPGQDIESSGSSERWRDLEAELDDLSVKVRYQLESLTLSVDSCLLQLEEINEQLATLASTPDLMSPSMLRAIQRHRELHQDNMRELKRTKVHTLKAKEMLRTHAAMIDQRQTCA